MKEEVEDTARATLARGIDEPEDVRGVARIAPAGAGGSRERTLPAFLIGAHAAIADYKLLTRDAARYRTYFPELNIVSPETHPSGAPKA